ncbi:MAG: glycosyltransferase [Gordonibacter pamelaeae]
MVPPDESGDYCDRLGKRDARIVVYHKTNGGLSDARNYGLRKAFGQWISFVDGNDYVSPAFIEVLLKAVLDHGCSPLCRSASLSAMALLAML